MFPDHGRAILQQRIRLQPQLLPHLPHRDVEGWLWRHADLSISVLQVI